LEGKIERGHELGEAVAQTMTITPEKKEKKWIMNNDAKNNIGLSLALFSSSQLFPYFFFPFKLSLPLD
jgi:hypothetical protein